MARHVPPPRGSRSPAAGLRRPRRLCYTQAVHGPTPLRPRRPRPRARRIVAFEQLDLALASSAPRWTFSRLIRTSPHQARIVERLEFVRRFFPELDGISIHVGRAIRRDVLGWGSMDPERPGIWIRPRRLAFFTIAHELTHLLQARELLPEGERACDLWAMARSPLVIDSLPGYLRVPRVLRTCVTVEPATASLLHRLACLAIARRAAGERRYLAAFEREVAECFAGPRLVRARRRPEDGRTLALALE